MKVALVGALALLSACSARFVDERPLALRGRDGAPGATGSGGDLAGVDLGRTLVAQGSFMGRAGHFAEGPVELWRRDDGVLELHLGAGFAVTDVPGPEIYLSAREAMGTSVADADLDFGQLRTPMGAQTFAVLADDAGRRNLFIYCRPFGIEVAKALLSP